MASVEVLAGPERRRRWSGEQEAGDCSGGIRTRSGGSRCGTSGRCDAEFDLPLESGSASRGEWLRSGAGGTGWQWCRRTGGAVELLTEIGLRGSITTGRWAHHYRGVPIRPYLKSPSPLRVRTGGSQQGSLARMRPSAIGGRKSPLGQAEKTRRRDSTAGPHSTAETLLTPTPPEVPRAATRITPGERLNRTQRPTEEYIRCELRQFALGIEGSLRPRGQGARPCRHN
jgi:hypothetical protein